MTYLIVFMDADTSGTVRKTGGNFKEKLRELGGLDAVFDVARSCYVVMEVVACMFLDLIFCGTILKLKQLKQIT